MNVSNISKERFEKAKKKIIKKYPGAHTVMDPNGQYYVATENGRDINNLQIGQTMNAYDFEKACQTAGLVMQRRGITFDVKEERILSTVFEDTKEFRGF